MVSGAGLFTWRGDDHGDGRGFKGAHAWQKGTLEPFLHLQHNFSMIPMTVQLFFNGWESTGCRRSFISNVSCQE